MIFLQQHESASMQAERGCKVGAMRFGVLTGEHCQNRTEKQEGGGFCMRTTVLLAQEIPGCAKEEVKTEGGRGIVRKWWG